MRKKISFKEVASVLLSVLICVGVFYFYTKSGSLTPPPGAPGSTMFSFSDIAGSGFSSTTHSLAQIKAGIGTNADAAAMNTTLFAGQQYIADAVAAVGGVTWKGYTSSAYTGNLGGTKGANDKCNTEYAGSHACTWDEIIRLGTAYPWTTEAWVIDGAYTTCYNTANQCRIITKDLGSGYTLPVGGDADGNCRGWTTVGAGLYAPVALTTGNLSIVLCDAVTRKLACCY